MTFERDAQISKVERQLKEKEYDIVQLSEQLSAKDCTIEALQLDLSKQEEQFRLNNEE